MKIHANRPKENGFKKLLKDKNLQNKRGLIGDRKNLVVKNTEEFRTLSWIGIFDNFKRYQ